MFTFPLDVPPPADPEALVTLAQACIQAAEQHDSVANGLDGVFESLNTGPQSWKGNASVTYRDAWGSVSGDMKRTAAVARDLADRLYFFASGIRDIQVQLRVELAAAEAAGPEAAPAMQEAARAKAEADFLFLDQMMGLRLEQVLPAIPITRLHQGYVGGTVAEPEKAALADGAIAARTPTNLAKDRRNSPGVATLEDPNQFARLADHLNDPNFFRPNRYQIRIPREVAEALNGRQFQTFGKMRAAFWVEMEKTFQSQLGSDFTHSDTLFTKVNWARMRGEGDMDPGTAPIAPQIFQSDKSKSFNADHIAEIQYELVGEEGEVYQLDNLQIIAPSVHDAKTEVMDVMGPDRIPADYFSALPADLTAGGE